MRLVVLLLLFLLLLVAGLPAHGAAGAEGDGATELALQVGETRLLTPGPVRQVLCDQGGIVEVASGEQGNGFRAVAVGETTCSLFTADGLRRVYRVKVSPKTDAPPSRPGS